MQYKTQAIERERDLLMDSSEIHNLLIYLQRLEASWDSDHDMKDVIRRLKLKISLLISEWPVDEHGNQEVCVLEDVIPQLKGLGMDSGERRTTTPTAGELVLQNLEKLKFIKPEMKRMYSAVFKGAKPMTSESTEDVLTFISLLHENLKNIISSKAGILVPVKPLVLALQDELRFLRNFLIFISEICIEHRFSKDLFTYAQVVSVNIAYLLNFLRVDKKMGGMENGVRIELLDLVEKLNPLQQPELREIYLRALEGTNPELLHLTVIDYECILRFLDSVIENLGKILSKPNLEFTAKNQIEILQQELSSLRFYLVDLPLSDSNEKLDKLMFKIQDLSIHAGCFIYSSVSNKDNEIAILALDDKFGGLLDKIEGVKSESDHFIMPKSWQLNFPMTNEPGYLDFIVKNLKEKLHSISAPIDPLANEVNTIYEELLALRDDFSLVAMPWNENQELRALVSRYRDVTYQTEYFVDSFLCGVVPFWSQKMGLVNLVKDLCHIKKELKFVLKDNNIDHGTGKSLSFVSPQAKPLSSNAVQDSEDNVRNTKENDSDQLVGLEDEVKNIIDQIMGGSDQLTILSITGMPGLGKTTLANSVYKDPSVTMQFHASAWCSVSQVYNKENLLLEILHQVKPKSKEDDEKDEKNFDQKLYQSLKGKRYLVVLDDIWDIEAWNVLRPSFPDDNNHSRIIFTTRNLSVAVQANSVPNALRLLSDKECWKLLLVRVFKEENCPPELFQVGKKIAENCKGLPLTVVLTAGLLKISEKSKDSWEQLANVLISHEVDHQRDHLGILDLSYRHLPDHLRPCFLYFGSFPEDAIIPAWKLVRLWIAEGFVQSKAGLESLELEAENYLNALIDRSLVMIAKRSYKGGVKACRIHDLLHDFCTDRAREERFLLKMKRGDSHSPLTDAEVHQQYRLRIVQSNTLTVPQVRTGHFESRIRSLWFTVGGKLPKNPNSTRPTSSGMPSSRLFSPPPRSKFIYYNKLRGVEVFFKFRLLRVLDLGTLDIVAEDSFDTITQLVHLRYLSLLAYTGKIPAEIENLKDLETFLVTGTRLGYVALPETIWNMVNLKHIQIKKGATALFPSEFIDNCNNLDGLTSLSTLVLHHGNELERTMKKLPNLKQLKCTFLGSWDDAKNQNSLSVLDFMDHLEELNISSLDQNIVYPPGLKKLTLSELALFSDQISAIGELPNLEVLKLVHVALGDEWYMKEGEFETLKFLTLDDLNIRVWDASLEHLPCLEQLVVKVCRYLEGLPCVGESPFLRMIEVSNCNTSVVDSAKEIQDEQYELGNCQFKLYISGYHWEV